MKLQLKEIVIGSAKGLAGASCAALIVGLPAAEGLYKSIKTEQGKNAYSISGGLLIATGLTMLYSIGN